MHDTELDTFEPQSVAQAYSALLAGIGVSSSAKESGTDEVEQGDYYSRYFASSPRMITNRGCIDVSDTNVDVIHIIQKG